MLKGTYCIIHVYSGTKQAELSYAVRSQENVYSEGGLSGAETGQEHEGVLDADDVLFLGQSIS